MSTVAGTFDMGSDEVRNLAVDSKLNLAPGETITTVAATLVRLDTGATVAGGAANPQISGTQVQATAGPLDPAVGFYRLRFRLVTSAGQTEDADLILTCSS